MHSVKQENNSLYLKNLQVVLAKYNVVVTK